jgi:hypothetical protein
MSEKQLRITNVLLFLILIILILNLAVDLFPYYLTGRIFSSFSSSTNNSPPIIYTRVPDPDEIPHFIIRTKTP